MEEDPADYPVRPTPAMRWAVLKAADWLCTFCGSHRDMQVDHVVPIARGGRANPGNLQALCGLCNATKQHRVYDGAVPPPSITAPVLSLRLSDDERARLMEWGGTVREAVLALLDAADKGCTCPSLGCKQNAAGSDPAG